MRKVKLLGVFAAVHLADPHALLLWFPRFSVRGLGGWILVGGWIFVRHRLEIRPAVFPRSFLGPFPFLLELGDVERRGRRRGLLRASRAVCRPFAVPIAPDSAALGADSAALGAARGVVRIRLGLAARVVALGRFLSRVERLGRTFGRLLRRRVRLRLLRQSRQVVVEPWVRRTARICLVVVRLGEASLDLLEQIVDVGERQYALMDRDEHQAELVVEVPLERVTRVAAAVRKLRLACVRGVVVDVGWRLAMGIWIGRHKVPIVSPRGVLWEKEKASHLRAPRAAGCVSARQPGFPSAPSARWTN